MPWRRVPHLSQAQPAVCETALMALAKLMAVDSNFCEAHMQLLFTRLSNRCVRQG